MVGGAHSTDVVQPIGLVVAGLCAAGWGERGSFPARIARLSCGARVADSGVARAAEKSEIRSSKSQTNPKFEIGSPKSTCGLRFSPWSRRRGAGVRRRRFGSGESAFLSHAPGSRTGAQVGNLCYSDTDWSRRHITQANLGRPPPRRFRPCASRRKCSTWAGEVKDYFCFCLVLLTPVNLSL